MNKWVLIGISSALFAGFLGWLFIASAKPTPGEKIVDLGRKHIPIGEKVEYNSNPPTSGPHFEDWVRAGIYESEKDDRNLVHSLEHGYIIMSYNCDFKAQSSRQRRGSPLAAKLEVQSVQAHGIEEELPSSSSNESSVSANLSNNFRSEECHKLVDQLISIYEIKGKRKLIIVPRSSLDSKVALTAWTYIDKLQIFDKERIEKFIDAHFNQGPEQTME